MNLQTMIHVKIETNNYCHNWCCQTCSYSKYNKYNKMCCAQIMCNHRIIRIPTCVCSKHAKATNCTNPNNISIQLHNRLSLTPIFTKNHSYQSKQYVVVKQILKMIWMMTIWFFMHIRVNESRYNCIPILGLVQLAFACFEQTCGYVWFYDCTLFEHSTFCYIYCILIWTCLTTPILTIIVYLI